MSQGGNAVTLSLAGLGAVLGALATGWSAWNNDRIADNARELERSKYNAEYRLAVFESVADALNSSDPRLLAAAQSLVLTLPDEESDNIFRQELTILLCQGGNDAGAGGSVVRVCAELEDIPTDEEGSEMVAEAIAPAPDMAAAEGPMLSAPAPGPSAGALEDAAPPRAAAPPAMSSTRVSASVAPRGSLWNVDVFFCEGANEAANRQRAQSVFDILQREAETPSGGAIALGRVRLRPLTEAVNARNGYGISADIVRAESGEGSASTAVRNLVTSGQGPALQAAGSRSPTPYYLSAFLCAG